MRIRCSVHTRFIIHQVSQATGITVSQLLSSSTARRLSRPRHLAMWLIRRHTGETLRAIGEAFRRDHSTVHHAITTAAHRIQSDPDTRRTARAIEASLGRYATQPPLSPPHHPQERHHAHP
jgi:chromosomal replication initiator protein